MRPPSTTMPSTSVRASSVVLVPGEVEVLQPQAAQRCARAQAASGRAGSRSHAHGSGRSADQSLVRGEPARARRRAGPGDRSDSSSRSASRGQPQAGVDAEPAQRLRLPPRRAVVDPGQRGQRGVAAQDQVGQGAPGEVAGGDAVADVAARPAGAGRPGPRHRRGASRGRCRAGRPSACVNATPSSSGKQVAQRRAQRGEDGGLLVELGPDPASRQWYGRAATAEGDPAVVGALAVDDDVAVVGEHLAAGQADPRPSARRRSARWRPSASRPGRPAATSRRACRSSPRWRRPRSRREIRCPSASTTTRSRMRAHVGAARRSRPPSRRDRRGQAVDQPARVHPGAVRGEGGAARRRRRRAARGWRRHPARPCRRPTRPSARRRPGPAPPAPGCGPRPAPRP